MSCLHHIFTKAVEWEMIEQNPFGKGKSLILKENNKRLRFLNEDEILKLLDACPKYLHNIVECALNTVESNPKRFYLSGQDQNE